MSYAALASNQWISRNNLQDAVNTSVFAIRNSIPATDEWVTKDDVNYYVFIDTSYGPYAAKAGNRWITKNDLVAQSCITLTFGATFDGSTGMSININISSPIPAPLQLDFTFATNNSCTGTVTMYFNTGAVGPQTLPSFDTTNTSGSPIVGGGATDGTYDLSWTAGLGTVSVFYPSLTSYSTSDTVNCYQFA